MRTPVGSCPSMRVMSWLNRLRMEPLSVVEKKDWGALEQLTG